MGGGLLQIVAYGAQDVYLTGNPQITFFKTVYRRHTNFSIESIKQTFNGNGHFGNEISATLQRSADLVHKIYFQTTLPSVDISYGLSSLSPNYKAFRWLNWIGHILIKKVEISIGGQLIDRQYGEWFHIWNELSQDSGKKNGYAEMVGNVPSLTQIYSSNTTNSCSTDPYTLYVPLQFWFCRNPGMALPLIALQYNDIIINIELRNLDECIWANEQDPNGSFISKIGSDVIDPNTQLKDTYLYVDYIFLDTDERRRFAQVPHEYLIEQLQFSGEETISTPNTSNNIKLNFTHPVKEIIWVVQPTNFISSNYTQSRCGRQYYNFTDLWDYSNFTGTPEPLYGTGMGGGKNNYNILAYPPVKVEGKLDKNNNWDITGINSSVTQANAGFNDIKYYNKPNISYTPNQRKNIFSLLSNNTSLDESANPITKAKIVLNGNDRFGEREGKYFNLVQPYQHHTNCPAIGINIYSFSITPEDHQPSGTCNFSKIDNAFLNITTTNNTISSIYNSGNANIRVYALNYNILRIMSGMGGLAYSN